MDDGANPDGALSDIEGKERKFHRHLEMGRAAIADTLGINLHDFRRREDVIAERRQALLDELPSVERRDNPGFLRQLGRTATAGVKAVDRGFTLAAWKVASWMPGMKSMDERQAAYDRRQEKYAPSDDDNFFMQRWKHFLRHREKYIVYTAISGLGALAVSRYTGVAMDWYDHHNGIHGGNALDAAAGNHPEIQAGTHKLSMVVAGGRGEGGMDGQPGAPVAEMMQYGNQYDVNVQAVQYPAQIAPLDQMSMRDSTNIGVADMMRKAQADMASGKPVELIGFSEGTSVALNTAKQIAAQNGGVLPSNVHLTLIGSPYTPGSGIAASPFAKGMIGGMVDAMGIPLNEGPLPPGTNVVYYDTDFWANSGNQVPTSMMRQLVEIGMGGHAVPNPNDPHYCFTDGQGVIHTVYTHRNDPILQSLMDNNGLQVVDTATANRAINDFFPLDGSKPDVAAGLHDLATTLEHQPDPASQFAGHFLESLPPEYSALGQMGMDGINGMAEGAAKIQSGDVIGGWQDMTAGLKSFTNLIPAAENVVGINTNGGGSGYSLQMLTDNVAGALKQQTGMDFSQQIGSFVNNGQMPMVNGQSVNFNGGAGAGAGGIVPSFSPNIPSHVDTAIQPPSFPGGIPLPQPTPALPSFQGVPVTRPIIPQSPSFTTPSTGPAPRLNQNANIPLTRPIIQNAPKASVPTINTPPRVTLPRIVSTPPSVPHFSVPRTTPNIVPHISVPRAPMATIPRLSMPTLPRIPRFGHR